MYVKRSALHFVRPFKKLDDLWKFGHLIRWSWINDYEGILDFGQDQGVAIEHTIYAK